ncbi:50S ribosomal protein L18 [Paenibacillus sp. 28ISP30-2]|nr:50S ribosomal protein L18 [Paenibacillus sp. 28ISP30-2]
MISNSILLVCFFFPAEDGHRVSETRTEFRRGLFPSNHAQLIDDVAGVTLVSASTMDKELSSEIKNGGSVEAASKVGELVAKRAKEKGHANIVFDRGGYLYHGRIQALADAAREAGLEF